MLAFFNTQTLALLAVAIGFVVLCLGLWYLWTNHAQLRTEVQLLRSQQNSGGEDHPTLSNGTESLSSPVPDNSAADITALMRGDATEGTSSPNVRVCRMPEAYMAATTHVEHRTNTKDGDDASEDSETSGSEYEDDTTDNDDDEDEEKEEDTGAAEVNNAPTKMNETDTVPNAGQPPVDLVESLLSSMVTNAIDGAVELQGGATVIMSCVDVGDGDDVGAEAGTEGAVTVEDVTEADEAVVEAAVEASTEAAVTDDDAASALDAGAAAFADELRSHTVAQLKVICQEHQLGVRRTNGSIKRKDELVADLVAALYEGGGEDDAQDTASNESANTAGA